MQAVKLGSCCGSLQRETGNDGSARQPHAPQSALLALDRNEAVALVALAALTAVRLRAAVRLSLLG
jgi:hypothetical protein